MSQHGPAGYAPYKTKRLSTQSVQSVNAPVPSSPPVHGARPAGLMRPSSTSAIVPTLNNSPVKSPQPYRPIAATSWSHTGLVSGTASSSTPPPPNSGRPTPTQSMSALPYSNVSSEDSSFNTPRQQRSQSPAVGTSAGSSHKQDRSRLLLQSTSQSDRARAPFHSTFQPQGVRRDRTEEFLSKRRVRGEGRKLEEGRLNRRLEKLLALHFPPQDDQSLNKAPSRASTLSAFTAFGESLRGKSAKELWSTVAGNRGEIERAEQGIVKWQDDNEAKHCPICMASFGLKARRHHCRLCGRVVCFLPPTGLPAVTLDPPSPSTSSAAPKPIRIQRCSTFITYEQTDSLEGEKRPLGIIVEIEPTEQDMSFGAMTGENNTTKETDDRKKVRVCRECLNTIMREQLKTLPVKTPTWLKLYDVLVQLESEIDEVLPEFQELVLGLQKPSSVESTIQPSIAQAKSLRNRLLSSLASYDTISKRIKDLPLNEGSYTGGSQDRLQQAIAARGSIFLSDKLALLRSLGNMEELSGSSNKKKAKQESSGGETTVKTLASLLAEGGTNGETPSSTVNEKVGLELEASGRLAVLLEQEALVRSYVEDANSRRQFEDAASLKASLDELRAEISSVRATLT